MKAIIHKIDCPIYSGTFYVCFDRETVNKKAGEFRNDWEGMTSEYNDGMLIYLDNNDGYGLCLELLAHEVFHAVDMFFSKIGVEHNDGGSNEHWAYMIGWLSGKVYDCFNKERKLKGLNND